MKTQDIVEGRIYFDGKHGLRQVVKLLPQTGEVRYKLLHAKALQSFEYSSGPVDLTGHEATMLLHSFASWAKHGYDEVAGGSMLLKLRAHRIKLSQGEKALMESVLQEVGAAPKEGTAVSFERSESRAVAGLERKGLVRRLHDSELQILPLGAAKFLVRHGIQP